MSNTSAALASTQAVLPVSISGAAAYVRAYVTLGVMTGSVTGRRFTLRSEMFPACDVPGPTGEPRQTVTITCTESGVSFPVAAGPASVDQCLDEGGGLERRQVVGALAQADQLDRHTEFALHSDDDAALRGAVEFGQHDAGDVDDLSEHPGLHHPVLPRGGVEHEQHLIDRSLLLDDALELAQFVHQSRLGMQPAGGVNEHGVHPLLGSGADRVERDAGRVCPLGAAHGRRPDAAPQVCSWSAAAARKVSAAPSS